MNISEKGLSLIKEFEGCQLTSYLCPSHVWTIGWGHTGSDIVEGITITQDEADYLLEVDMVEYSRYVDNCSELTFVPNQNQYDALVSFVYNCGEGCLQTLVSNRSASVVAVMMLLYNRGSDGVLAGLVRRRAEEQALFLSTDITTETETETETETVTEIDYSTAELQNELGNQGYRDENGERLELDNIGGALTISACPTVKIGANGNITRWIQKKLGVIDDGIFGEVTRNAVVAFQVQNGLWADGIVGKLTWAVLINGV